jgi:hypothetical protein
MEKMEEFMRRQGKHAVMRSQIWVDADHPGKTNEAGN